MPNAQEARFISHRSNLEKAISRFHEQGVRLVTVKLGAEGALVDDGQATLRRKVAAVSGGDSIGAGDSFDAGFLAGWLRRLPLER